MKTILMTLSLLVLPASLFASIQALPANTIEPPASIPNRFSSTSETATLEWGCPVSEVVKAESRSEALKKIQAECMEQVSRAAHEKPEVVDVINTSVIWPDVQISEADGGYHMNGTFFLETLVLQQLNVGH